MHHKTYYLINKTYFCIILICRTIGVYVHALEQVCTCSCTHEKNYSLELLCVHVCINAWTSLFAYDPVCAKYMSKKLDVIASVFCVCMVCIYMYVYIYIYMHIYTHIYVNNTHTYISRLGMTFSKRGIRPHVLHCQSTLTTRDRQMRRCISGLP